MLFVLDFSDTCSKSLLKKKKTTHSLAKEKRKKKGALPLKSVTKMMDRLPLIDADANRRYLLEKTQHCIGGFGKNVGDPPGKLKGPFIYR